MPKTERRPLTLKVVQDYGLTKPSKPWSQNHPRDIRVSFKASQKETGVVYFPPNGIWNGGYAEPFAITQGESKKIVGRLFDGKTTQVKVEVTRRVRAAKQNATVYRFFKDGTKTVTQMVSQKDIEEAHNSFIKSKKSLELY